MDMDMNLEPVMSQDMAQYAEHQQHNNLILLQQIAEVHRELTALLVRLETYPELQHRVASLEYEIRPVLEKHQREAARRNELNIGLWVGLAAAICLMIFAGLLAPLMLHFVFHLG